ncbi:MAG: epoxyqueuosine reductase QueH [Synergistaceae bacterium]|jgi:predicted adenine nucleotide alpha hydrolase (AANH) superfamily ATPase|nr:epoxyqueuosine reductase QueH [Synergistaceae bacterium]
MKSDGRRVLLHICCAPDATAPWPALTGEGFEVHGFFYGDNIHPESEWRLRADAVARLPEFLNGRLVARPYSPSLWFEKASRLSDCPEGGERCALCFGLQLTASAEYAAGNGFGYLCTTLTISPHKDPDLINDIGRVTSSRFGVEWISRVWRKGGGFKLSVERSKAWGLYRQSYCGCEYSMRSARGR